MVYSQDLGEVKGSGEGIGGDTLCTHQDLSEVKGSGEGIAGVTLPIVVLIQSILQPVPQVVCDLNQRQRNIFLLVRR